MSLDPTSTVGWPAYSGSTQKRDFIRALVAELYNSANGMDIVYSFNNSDWSSTTDGATVYDTADTFSA